MSLKSYISTKINQLVRQENYYLVEYTLFFYIIHRVESELFVRVHQTTSMNTMVMLQSQSLIR